MKVEEKNKAIELRNQGWSYGKIANDLGVAKSSVSLWCNGIELSEEHKAKLAENCRLNSIIFGKRNKDKWDAVKKEMLNNYNPPLDDPEFMLGLGLYWGEGTKYDKSRTELSNCDIGVLKQFINWINKFYFGDFEKISITIHHYYKERDDKIIEYWSNELNLPLESFRKSCFQVSKSSKMKKGNIQPNGTVHIRCMGQGVWKIRQKIGKALSLLSNDHCGSFC